MRIFNVMFSFNLGGIEQAYLDYNNALKMQGHDVINISRLGAKVNKYLANSIKLPYITNFCLLSRVYFWFLLLYYKPDVIIAHGGKSICFVKPIKFNSMKLIGVSHVYTYSRFKQCDYMVVMTDHLKQYMVDNGYDEKKIFKIPNMIHVDEACKPKNIQKPFVIGSYGRFVEQKGYQYLIEAARLLKEKGCDFKLKLGGGGELEPVLEKQVEDLGLTSCVEFVGWVKDKKEFFKEVDVFCLPSLIEPFGIVLLEAMKYSVPIVASRVSGPSEILSNDKYGLLADSKSGQDLADKIMRFIDNPDLAKEKAVKAYNKLEEEYDIKVVAPKISKMLKKLKGV